MAPTSRVSSTAGRKIHHHDQLQKGLACDCCRRRKVRCTGATPACSACLRTAKYEGKAEADCVCHYSGKMRGKRVRRREVKIEELAEMPLDESTRKNATTSFPSFPPPSRSEESQSPYQPADFYGDVESFPWAAQDWTTYVSPPSSGYSCTSDSLSTSYDSSPPSSFYTPSSSSSQLPTLDPSIVPLEPSSESLPIFDEQFLDFNLFPSYLGADSPSSFALFPPQPTLDAPHPEFLIHPLDLVTPEAPIIVNFLPSSQWSDPDALARYLAAMNEDRLGLGRGVWEDEMALLFEGLGEGEVARWGVDKGVRCGEWVR